MITLCGYHSGMRGMWVILAFCLAMPIAGLRADTLEGKAVLVDGDSIVIGHKQIRLWGIDAPEMDTREGYLAKRYLRSVIEEKPVRCVEQGARVSSETMAKCYVGQVDIGEVMVLSGHARDWVQYSQGFYSR
jgi:endonuclease YncB( thermonuclease family)